MTKQKNKQNETLKQNKTTYLTNKKRILSTNSTFPPWIHLLVSLFQQFRTNYI